MLGEKNEVDAGFFDKCDQHFVFPLPALANVFKGYLCLVGYKFNIGLCKALESKLQVRHFSNHRTVKIFPI
jgi:hypothetical protein